MPDRETVEDLLECVDELITQPVYGTNALRLRVATAVCRRAAELAVGRYLSTREPSLADSPNMRGKMLCVRVHWAYDAVSRTADDTAVRHLNWAWCSMSSALHYRPEAVPPNLSEVRQWRDAVREFVVLAANSP